MSDDAPATDLQGATPASVVDLPEDEALEVTPLSLYDAAMAPYLARLQGIGVVTEHQLLGALTAVRNALAVVFSGPPETPTGESLDMLGEQRRAARDAQVAGEPVEEPLPPPPEEPPPSEPETSAPTNVFS